MKKLKRKQKRNIIILGIVLILIAFLYQNYHTLSFLDSTNTWYNKTLTLNNIEVESRSALPYGEYVRVGRYNSYTNLLNNEGYTIDWDCPGVQPNCYTNEQFINNIFDINENSFVYNFTSNGRNAGPSSVMSIGNDDVLIFKNIEIDTNLIENFSLDYKFDMKYNADVGRQNPPRFNPMLKLVSETKGDITLYSIINRDIQENGTIKVERNTAGIGYFLEVNGAKSNLNIPLGKYKLVLYAPMSESQVMSGTSLYKYIEISNINFQNANTCESGKRLCSDGICKESCSEKKSNYLWIIGIIILLIGLIVVYRRVKN